MQLMTSNPLLSISESFAEYELTSADKAFNKNCHELRSMIGGVIDEKKVKNDPDANDVASLLLGDPSYQDTSDLIDDVIVMFFAGSKTVQGTITNFITTMLHEPEEFARLKAETDGIMDKVKDDIMGKFDLESIQDLD